MTRSYFWFAIGVRLAMVTILAIAVIATGAFLAEVTNGQGETPTSSGNATATDTGPTATITAYPTECHTRTATVTNRTPVEVCT